MIINENIKKDGRLTRLIPIVLLFIVLGGGVYTFNYERQTINIASIPSEQTIIEYYAPTWDPLPHHVKIQSTSTVPVIFDIVISNGKMNSETFSMEKGQRKIDVYPGEMIKISLENPDSGNGVVKTVLWCDSWNYAAAVLVSLGIILIFSSLLQPWVRGKT
jgi:hypothetical protein